IHPGWNECDVVAVVKLPATSAEDPALTPELLVKRGPAVGRQNAHERDVDADIVELARHRPYGFRCIAVKAGDKTRHDADTAPVQRLEALAVLSNPVLSLSRVDERVLAERFDSEEDSDAARLTHEVEQRVVLRDVHARLSQPPSLQRHHSRKQLAHVLTPYG